jgi:hypothetical protein
MGSVRRDKRRDDPDPTMGYDRDLDRKVRVGSGSFPLAQKM